MFGLLEFILCFRVAQKNSCELLYKPTFRKKLRNDSESGCGCLLLAKTRKHLEKQKNNLLKTKNTKYQNIS